MLPIAMLVVSGLLLLLALFAFWQSVRALFGNGVDEISAAIGGDRAALVDEKNSLLRALKDIEFERAVGKVSDADWKRLDASYRARAKDVLGELDKDLGPWREKAEKLVQERLGKGGASTGAHKGKAQSKAERKAAKAKSAEPAVSDAAPGAKAADAEPAEDTFAAAPPAEEAPAAEPENATATAEPAKTVSTEPAAKQACPSCAAQNESDAVFCKKCAARLGASPTEEAS